MLQRTDMWILGGFLGAGKTTLLNDLLRGAATGEQPGAEAGRIGVVVNDFGSVGVDAALLEGATEDEVVELNGGQIFCACLSGSFVQAIARLAAHGVDTLLVESSGLAKPRPLRDIVDAAVEAVSKAGRRLDYRGFVAVVDAPRFLKLERVVNAVPEQVVFADLLVVGKTDLVDTERVTAVVQRLRELNPRAAIVQRGGGGPTLSALAEALAAARESGTSPEGSTAGASPAEGQNAAPWRPPEVPTQTAEGMSFRGWNGAGRPVSLQWSVPEGLSADQLRRLIAQLSLLTWRVKGFVRFDDERFLVSAAGESVKIERKPETGAPGAGKPAKAAGQGGAARGSDGAAHEPDGAAHEPDGAAHEPDGTARTSEPAEGDALTVIAAADVNIHALIEESLASVREEEAAVTGRTDP
jgi:G3E family GTPase